MAVLQFMRKISLDTRSMLNRNREIRGNVFPGLQGAVRFNAVVLLR